VNQIVWGIITVRIVGAKDDGLVVIEILSHSILRFALDLADKAKTKESNNQFHFDQV